MVRCYIAIDIICHYIRQSPYGKGVGGPPLLSDTLLNQIWFGWLNAARSYFELSYPYHLCAFLAVGLGLTEPALWPPIFGPVKEAYTVRNLWGKRSLSWQRCGL